MRSVSSGPMRSSSCAQTADAQVTVSTPSRSPVGSACAATTSPTASGHTRWTSASVVCGASRSASAAMACDSARGSRRLMRARARGVTTPPSTRRRTTSSSSAPGTCATSVVVTSACPTPQALDEPLAAAEVELAHDVVEEQQRRRAALLLQDRALGEQQREQAHPLLALRAVGAQLAPVAQQRDVVAVRAVGGEAALEVGVEALGQLGRQRLGASSARERGR